MEESHKRKRTGQAAKADPLGMHAAVRTLQHLLDQIHVPVSITSLRDCVPTLWVALFEGLFETRVPGILRRNASTHSARVHNVQLVLDELAATVLKTDLGHIGAEAVVEGDMTAIINLIEIFGEIGRVLGDGTTGNASSRGRAAPVDGDSQAKSEAEKSDSDVERDEGYSTQYLGKLRANESYAFHPQAGTFAGADDELSDDVQVHRVNEFDEHPGDGSYLGDGQSDIEESMKGQRSPKRHRPATSYHRTPPALRVSAKDTPYTKALKQRRARLLRSHATLRGSPRTPPRLQAPWTVRETGRDISNASDTDASEGHSLPVPEKNIQLYTHLVQEGLPGIQIPDKVNKNVWKDTVQTWERALNERTRRRKVQLQEEASKEDVELKNMRATAASLKRSLIQRQKQKEVDALRAADAELKERRRRLIKMEMTRKDVRQQVNGYKRKWDDQNEQLSRKLFDSYAKKQKAAILEERRRQQDLQKQRDEEKRRKEIAKENFYRDQIQILTEQLERSRKEEVIVIKAFEEEKRRLLRDQKSAAKAHIKRIREKLDVDVNSHIFRHHDAENLVENTAFAFLQQ
ncbi:Centrosomal protein of 95 kDa [Gaertneriomyces sp. JEL0708]|nr:Centrosomal protein of 95 kDa [Gaertneriomyces sp. JEL0708]